MQNGLAGQEEEEQNEAMNAMVPTQPWDDNGAPWNPPLDPAESPIALGEDSKCREVCNLPQKHKETLRACQLNW